MKYFYVNKNEQSNGDHEVHQSGCSFMPEVQNRIYLGQYIACSLAVAQARRYYVQVNGCYYCCNSCHTS